MSMYASSSILQDRRRLVVVNALWSVTTFVFGLLVAPLQIFTTKLFMILRSTTELCSPHRGRP